MMVKHYDFIILGGGTAGSVLASRLASAFPHFTILVLEAGLDHRHTPEVYTPGLNSKLVGNENFDWKYTTTTQPGLDGRSIAQPRGKALGGCSVINSYALIYPCRQELDLWGKLGNSGWDWKSLKPYLRKFQTLCRVPSLFDGVDGLPLVSPPPRNDAENNGRIKASLPRVEYPLYEPWLAAWRCFGLENIKDPLEGEALGGYISTCHITADTRERSHAGVAYLDEETMKRDDLTVMTGVLIEKIEFAPKEGSGHGRDEDVRAVAVKYYKDGRLHRACVAKEVLLAAGVFGSPAILERSGIGSAELLKQHGIEVAVANENVGENLQDHIRVGLSFESTSELNPQNPLTEEEARKLYEERREGPLAENTCWTFGHLPLLRFLSGDQEKGLKEQIDLHLPSTSSTNPPTFSDLHKSYIRSTLLSPNAASATVFLARQPAVLPTDPSKKYISIFAMLSHPLSIGSSHISSPLATAAPSIDPKYFSHPLDLHVQALHLQAINKIIHTPPLGKYILQGGHTLPEGAHVETLEGAKEVCRKFSRTNYHPVGTCSMMPREMGGVVDQELKVYGVSNLRVVDASIFPVVPRGNVVSMVYAVAEKAADMVGRDWQGSSQEGALRRSAESPRLIASI